MAHIQPIILTHHNELTLLRATRTKSGGHALVVLHDPEHIAETLKVRRQRDLIRANNERHWS